MNKGNSSPLKVNFLRNFDTVMIKLTQLQFSFALEQLPIHNT